MKSVLLTAALFALNIAVTSARAGEQNPAGEQKVGGGSESLITLNATVTAIDQATREVTLADAEGNSHVITASEDVKNLAQVEVGDQLDVAYYESVTFEKLAPGADSAQLATAAVAGTAAPGEKPAAAAQRELSFVATVEAIDKDAETVDLKGPEGNTRTVHVRNPDNLDKVAVGDELLITLTQAIAVAVSEKAQAD